MSVESETASKPKLSKEEKEAKRARKEEKRKRKEAEAAAGAGAASASTSGPEPSRSAETEQEASKPSKKDKKRKLEDASGTGDAQGVTKKDKKDKKDKVASAEEAGSAPLPEETTPAVEGSAPLSKKQLKKLAKANAAASSSTQASTDTTTTATPSTSAAAPVAPASFSSEHTDYLTSNAITLDPHLYPPHFSIPSLPISASLQTYLKQFSKPTPIQACSWPPLLSGRDVVGIAETGSGKTLAFGVPGLNSLTASAGGVGAGIDGEKKKKKKGKNGSGIRMLVIAPTRELAQQSHTTLLALGEPAGIESVCIFGGVGKDDQIRGINNGKVGVVVGTPGRLLDLADSGDLDLSGIKYLVLDEADRMLDQGFENDIRRIIAHCPDHSGGRQTVMFSATWPESVRRLASTFLHDPVKITVGSDELSANKRIEQVVEVLDSSRDKDPRMLHHLRAFIKSHPSTPAAPTRILVFALYKKEAQRLEQTIRRAGYSIAALHGDMGQDARFKALDSFKDGKVNVLVATDVAARGLDIPDVGLVLNVTFPLTTEDFVHRCGRTGRAGKSGKAITFFTGENHERSLAGEFMRVLRDVGAEIPQGMERFPSTIKKKEHGSYGAFYKDTTNAPKAVKITFD